MFSSACPLLTVSTSAGGACRNPVQLLFSWFSAWVHVDPTHHLRSHHSQRDGDPAEHHLVIADPTVEHQDAIWLTLRPSPYLWLPS